MSMSACVGGRDEEKIGRQKAEELNKHGRAESASQCKPLTQ